MKEQVRALQEAGFSRDQIDALDDFMHERTVTKADLAETEGKLRLDLQSVESRVHSDFQTLRAEFQELRSEMKLAMQQFRSEAVMTRWMLGVTMGFTIAILTKLLI